MKTLFPAILVILVSALFVSAQSMFDRVNDFDGDGRADYAVTRDESGLSQGWIPFETWVESWEPPID